MEGAVPSGGFTVLAAHVLEDVVRGAELQAVLTSVVTLVEEQSAGMLCSVQLLDAERGTLHSGAAPNLPEEYVAAIEGVAVGPMVGSCGAAAATGETVVVEDIATHRNWERYREHALAHGLLACWSTPIRSREGDVLGTFAMYYRDARGPELSEREWVRGAVQIAALAILRDRNLRQIEVNNRRNEQLARLYAVSTRVNEAIARERRPEELFELACRIPVEHGLARLAWVGSYDEVTGTVTPVARFGAASDHMDGLVLNVRDPRFHDSPKARALRTGEPALSNDIANDPGFTWRDDALQHGLRACAVFPLRDGKRTDALLTIYSDEVGFFREEEVRVLTALADDIAFAIDSARAEQERRALVDTLAERVKELALLHRVARTLQTERPLDASLLHDVVRQLPSGWRYSEHCAARIAWGGYEVSTSGWRPTEWTQSAAFGSDDDGGVIEIAYLEPPPYSGEPFLPEEHELLRSLADMLTTHAQRASAEAALRQNLELQRIAGRVGRIGGWVLDLTRQRVLWSEEVRAIYELPPDAEPSMERGVEAYAPEHRDTVRRAVEACIKDGTPFDLEVQVVTRKGRHVWVRAVGRAVRDDDGNVVRLHGSLQDISDRRALEEQLRQAQKLEAVGKLAGGVAHDFNNLLTVILSYADLILADLEPHDPLHGDISEIRQAGVRASELTQQLLAFSRRQVLQPRVINLSGVVESMRKMLSRLVGEDVDVSYYTGDVGQVFADPGQVQQIVMNLAVNARDAMPRGGTITIETCNVDLDDEYAESHRGVMPGRYVLLSVSDTGTGMDAETRARIFEPFYTTKRVGEGTGLGLATVWGIVEQSGGHIWVYSEPGVGTTFKVYFPLVNRPSELPPALAEEDAPKGGTETVLVVEDENSVRELMCAVLRRAGYHVLAAQNGGEAFLVCEQFGGRIDLMVSDVIMPRMSGRELAERLQPLRPDMRVLYVSGYAENAIVHHGVLDSGIEFLAKPLTPERLLRKVRSVLDG